MLVTTQFEEMVMPRQVAGEVSHKQNERWIGIGKEIEAELDHVTDQEMREFLRVIDTLDFYSASADSVLRSQKLPSIALAALKRGLLHPEHGQMQAATVLQFWAAMQYHREPLKPVDSNRPIAMRFLAEHLGDVDPTWRVGGEKLNLFMEKLRALPRSEQRYFMAPTNFGSGVAVVTAQVGVRVFHPTVMIPSMGMMQTFLDVEYGEEAVILKPRTYLSTYRHIYDMRLTDTCDMMMPTPNAHGKSRCPKNADGFSAPWHHFSYHDFFHAILASAVGKVYRRAGTVAADSIRRYARTLPLEQQKDLKQVAVNIVEAKHDLFRKDAPYYHTLSKAHTFWFSLDMQLSIFDMTPDHRLLAIEAIYDGFVSEGKEPSDLNGATFDETFEFLAAENSYDRWPDSIPFHAHPLPQLKLPLMDRKAGEPLRSAAHYSKKLEQLS